MTKNIKTEVFRIAGDGKEAGGTGAFSQIPEKGREGEVVDFSLEEMVLQHPDLFEEKELDDGEELKAFLTMLAKAFSEKFEDFLDQIEFYTFHDIATIYPNKDRDPREKAEGRRELMQDYEAKLYMFKHQFEFIRNQIETKWYGTLNLHDEERKALLDIVDKAEELIVNLENTDWHLGDMEAYKQRQGIQMGQIAERKKHAALRKELAQNVADQKRQEFERRKDELFGVPVRKMLRLIERFKGLPSNKPEQPAETSQVASGD